MSSAISALQPRRGGSSTTRPAAAASCRHCRWHQRSSLGTAAHPRSAPARCPLTCTLWAAVGACCGKSAGPDSEIYEQARRSRLPDTEADRQARAAAAAAVSAGLLLLVGACVCCCCELLWFGRCILTLFAAKQVVPPSWTIRLQAEARQQAWAGTAAGKAALKSVQQVKEERAAGGRLGQGPDTAKDWLS